MSPAGGALNSIVMPTGFACSRSSPLRISCLVSSFPRRADARVSSSIARGKSAVRSFANRSGAFVAEGRTGQCFPLDKVPFPNGAEQRAWLRSSHMSRVSRHAMQIGFLQLRRYIRAEHSRVRLREASASEREFCACPRKRCAQELERLRCLR